MKRPLPLWLAAALPATLAGHGLAYALAGRSAADAHHAWMAPALECSLSLLAASCLLLVGGSLLRAGLLVHTAAERSWIAVWGRLAIVQVLLFSAMERGEGAPLNLAAILVQVLVALLTAYVLGLFARLLAHCAEQTQAACRYLERLLCPIVSFVSRRPAPMAHALAVRAGTSRFQRPPPAR